jgi:hypothetical protein
MGSLKDHPFYALWAGQLLNGLTAVLRITRPHGKRPVAVYYPIGHPTLYAYANINMTNIVLA